MVQLLSHHRRLVTMGFTKFQELSRLLAQHGITTQQILTYPEIYRRRYETVASRIQQLEEKGIRPITMGMINMTHKMYQARYERLVLEAEACEQYNDTVHFLSEHAGLSLPEAKKIFDKCQWLQDSRISTLKEKVEILQQYSISPEALREKVWIFAFRADVMKTSLEMMKNSGIQFKDFPPNSVTRIVRSDVKFKKFLERLLEDKAILQASNCADKHQYLCYRLACTQTELEGMLKRFPGCYSINLPKLKANLDLLVKEYNFTPSEIVATPRVLAFSTATLQDRIKRLNEAEMPVNCNVLVMPSRRFDYHISEHSSKAI